MPKVAKPTIWMGDSLAVLRGFPPAVRDEIGFALYTAQLGGKHISTKVLKGFSPGVLEVVSDYRGDAFRAVYTVRFPATVYVLHVFQKKSKSGIATPKHHVELIRHRLRRALELDGQRETDHA